MATRYGRTFRTRKGRYGRYKYVNGRRVSFVSVKRKSYRRKKYMDPDARARRRWDRKGW